MTSDILAKNSEMSGFVTVEKKSLKRSELWVVLCLEILLVELITYNEEKKEDLIMEYSE